MEPLATDRNVPEIAVGALAKAQAVREYVEIHQVSTTEALRELARRMRSLQSA